MESNTSEVGTAPDEFIKNQAATIDGDQTIENAVLAGPIIFLEQ